MAFGCPPPRSAAIERTDMKIASFNVNSIRARLPIVVGWLEKDRPDVLAVQETKVQDPDFPTEAFEDIGYQAVFRGQKSYNGVALFSRHAIHGAEFGLSDEPKDEPRLLKASVNGLTIVNTYVPQGYLADSEKFRYKLAWFDTWKGTWFESREIAVEDGNCRLRIPPFERDLACVLEPASRR